jgi:RNA polymerase sigma factor (sigma-70 family)
VNQPVGGPSVPLTSEHQDLVLEAKPMVDMMQRKLEKMFPHVSPDDIRQTVWLTVSELAPDYNPARGHFAAFAWAPVFGAAVDTFTLEARQNPLYMARRAFVKPGIHLKDPNEPFVSEEELVSGLQGVCHEGTFRLFFGATFETWRMQGEQGTVDHLTRLKVFGALQSAFTTLKSAEWELLERYYIACSSWADVAEALGIGERQVMRRAEEIREKLRRELLARGVRGAPPEQT